MAGQRAIAKRSKESKQKETRDKSIAFFLRFGRSSRWGGRPHREPTCQRLAPLSSLLVRVEFAARALGSHGFRSLAQQAVLVRARPVVASILNSKAKLYLMMNRRRTSTFRLRIIARAGAGHVSATLESGRTGGQRLPACLGRPQTKQRQPGRAAGSGSAAANCK